MRKDNGGEWWNVLVGAVVGAGISFIGAVVSEFAEQALDAKDEFDWGDVWISTGIGAVEGALVAIAPGMAGAISSGASALDTLIDGVRDGDNASEIVVDTLLSGAIGYVSGAGGSDFVKGGKIINEAATSLMNAIKKGVHPAVKKAARKAVKKAAKYIGKSFGLGVFEEFAYGGVYEFGSKYINVVVDRAFGR